jgi:protease-4
MLDNPAALAFLPGSELRLSSIYLDDRGDETGQGHALGFGFPLSPVNLGTALRLDLVDPPSDAARASFGSNGNYQWLTWGLAYRTSPGLAFGASLQRSFSSNPALGGLGSYSLGVLLRPSNYFALGLSGQDLNAPSVRAGTGLSRAYQVGIALRPLGKSAFEIGLDGSFVDGVRGYFVPRATLGVDIPSLGRLHGEVLVADPSEEAAERRFLAGLKLSIHVNGPAGSTELGAGALAGDAFGSEARWHAHQNLATTVAFQGFRAQAGVEMRDFALRIRVEDKPSPRGQLALLRRLWKIADSEPQVRAVVFQIRSAIGGSLAHMQELRDAVFLLRSRGKKVLCDLQDAGGGTLYFCSAADRIVLAPAGRIRFAGLSASYFFVPGLLEKLGIRAEYARIGAHKSAPEMFSHERSSETARSDHLDLLQQFERHITWGISQGRKIAPAELRRRVVHGPFPPERAKREGLVDRIAFADEVDAEVSELVGGSVPVLDDRAPKAASDYGVGQGVAVIYLDGDMVDGRSRSIPLLGVDLVGSYTIVEALQRASDDPRIGAIVIRLETPGGSALAADVIFRKIQLLRKTKPVVVSIGSVGASAGYYVAAAGSRVFANPLSITGSIGVFAGKVDSSELLRKIGVSLEVYKTAPRADADSLFRPLSEDERRELQRKVEQFYDKFLAQVSAGRATAGVTLSKADVDAVAQGRVWTGEQALARKLVDELGGLRQALAEARRLANLPPDSPIFELPEEEGNFVLRLLGLASSNARSVPMPSVVMNLARALGPLTVHGSEWPIARLEYVPIELER